MTLVPDPFVDRMLQSLTYPNPPAGFAAILVNIGGAGPAVIHVDLAEKKRPVIFGEGEVVHTPHGGLTSTLVSKEEAIGKAPDPHLNPEFWVRSNKLIMDYLHGGKKIQAIKEVRTGTSLSLKEAKDLVDLICQQDNIRP